jgi:regulator of RNase E activity RraA
MTAAVKTRGGVGAVVDAGIRDLKQIADLDFPVFARYPSPLDIRGRGELISFGTPTTCRGVEVVPGELVFADANGVVVVPAGSELAVLELCESRIQLEDQTERDLRKGVNAKEVYTRYETF